MLIWTSRNIPNVGLFSAYAEVFPQVQTPSSLLWAFLCLRRGVSVTVLRPTSILLFSLPTQRCFFVQTPVICLLFLFSAYAEVFPLVDSGEHEKLNFSLPTQRCFPCPILEPFHGHLFSAYAEVFPLPKTRALSWSPFLFLRRGVSAWMTPAEFISSFSLPTQRCF